MCRTLFIAPLILLAAALPSCAAPDEVGTGEHQQRHEHEQGSCEQEKGSCEQAKGSCEHAQGSREPEQGSCGSSAQIQSTKVETRRTPSGATQVHVGAELASAQVATVADILARPAAFDGKTVQVTGPVAAMCTHRRAWFSVVADDQSGRHLRVLTAPAFLVPEDAIGMTARVEGTIETEEITRERADYLARDHKVPYPEGDGPFRQPVLRATGANFE